jgi:hypothetical protein
MEAAVPHSGEPEAVAAREEEEGRELDATVWTGPPELIDACDAQLRATGARVRAASLPLHTTRGGLVCGAPQVVRYQSGPGGLRWENSPKVTCGLALALGRFESIVQEEAARHLGTRVRRIDHVGTYNCREMAAYPGWVSEHAYGNAIDIRAFVLAGGREVVVGRHWGAPGRPGATREGRFLRAVARRSFAEGVFSVVLTPAFDRAHAGHLHLDLARYRVDGTG